MRKRFWKGLKAIDLVIMIGLLMMVSAVVYVRYDAFACRSMQSEVKFSLNQIYAAQKLYHAEHDHFASLDILLNQDGRVVIGQHYYSFSDAIKPEQDRFSIQALGRAHTLVAGEAWLIDEKKELINVKSVCKK